MWWIESVFHVSPDNGDGSMEFAAALAVAVIAMALLARVVVRRKAWRQRMGQ